MPPRFDAFALGSEDDPYSTYARLRAAGPIWRGGPGQWLVPRYAEVAALLRDQRLGQFQFADAYKMFPGSVLERSLGEGPASVFTQRILVGRNRPSHTLLRRVISESLSRQLTQRLSLRIGDMVEELVRPALDGQSLDAVNDLAFQLPVRVLCETLGIPRDAGESVGRRVLKLAKIFAPIVPDSDRRAADEAVVWARDYFGGLLRERRRAPRSDLLSTMVSARGSEFSFEEIVDNAVFLLFAGLETSMSLIAGGCALFATHPAEFARLRSGGAAPVLAVEEVLRYETPTQITGRIALEELTVGRSTIRKGRVVLLMLGSANRDEGRFSDPEKLDITRSPNPHLSFGAGIHFCVGAMLARVEAASTFARLSSLFETLEPAGPVARQRNPTARIYRRVPVKGRPR